MTMVPMGHKSCAKNYGPKLINERGMKEPAFSCISCIIFVQDRKHQAAGHLNKQSLAV